MSRHWDPNPPTDNRALRALHIPSTRTPSRDTGMQQVPTWTPRPLRQPWLGPSLPADGDQRGDRGVLPGCGAADTTSPGFSPRASLLLVIRFGQEPGGTEQVNTRAFMSSSNICPLNLPPAMEDTSRAKVRGLSSGLTPCWSFSHCHQVHFGRRCLSPCPWKSQQLTPRTSTDVPRR